MTDSKTLHQLQDRVARLEEEILYLKTQLALPDERPWWERNAGTFENSALFDEVVRELQKIRRQEKQQVRTKARRSRKTKRPQVQQMANRKV